MVDLEPQSQGDPRVLFVMNLVLSFVFSYVVIWALSLVDALAFSWRTVGFATLGLMILTHVLVLR
ncbi:MAG: hypothetical protein ABEJ55_08865 [Halanaeroarchaeum sp.]